MQWSVSVKGVVFDRHGRVLLGLNDRDEWELLGGRLDGLALATGYRTDIDRWRSLSGPRDDRSEGCGS